MKIKFKLKPFLMKICFVAITILVLGCGTTDSIDPKGKELGYWGFKSSSGRTLKWNCTDSLTFQDTCNRQDTSSNDENWMDAIWGFLKQI